MDDDELPEAGGYRVMMPEDGWDDRKAHSKLDDLRRRAAQQAQYGNYWAGKCLGLLDKLREAEADAEGLRWRIRTALEELENGKHHDANALLERALTE